MTIEKEIDQLTHKLLAECRGRNAAVAVGACMNIIQTSMNYGNSEFRLATVEMLRRIADMGESKGLVKHDRH